MEKKIRRFVLQLNTVPQTVIHVQERKLTHAFAGTALLGPGEIDFPMAIARRSGIVGDKRRASLRTQRRRQTGQG